VGRLSRLRVRPGDLEATNTPADTQVPSYDDPSKKFKWVPALSAIPPDVMLLRNLMVTPFGTVGDDRSGGTGGTVANMDFYWVPETGSTSGSYMERVMNLPFKLERRIDVETGVNQRTNMGYSQRSLMLGSGDAVVGCHTYTDAVPVAHGYAAFWLVWDATYDHRILGVTRTSAGATITDLAAWAWVQRIVLRLVSMSDKVEFYVDGVLKATHTTNLPYINQDAYGRVGISNQAANNESEAFYYFKLVADY